MNCQFYKWVEQRYIYEGHWWCRTPTWVFLWEQYWKCLARMLRDSCRKSEAWWLLVHQLSKECWQERWAWHSWLPLEVSAEQVSCRPANSGVIGLSENSCHLLPAVHYHFFLSHPWHSDPCGWHSHSMTIPVLSGRWVLLFWECELEKKGELEKHNFTCALQVFHQVTAIIFSQPSIIVWYNLCVQYLTFRT